MICTVKTVEGKIYDGNTYDNVMCYNEAMIPVVFSTPHGKYKPDDLVELYIDIPTGGAKPFKPVVRNRLYGDI